MSRLPASRRPQLLSRRGDPGCEAPRCESDSFRSVAGDRYDPDSIGLGLRRQDRSPDAPSRERAGQRATGSPQQSAVGSERSSRSPHRGLKRREDRAPTSMLTRSFGRRFSRQNTLPLWGPRVGRPAQALPNSKSSRNNSAPGTASSQGSASPTPDQRAATIAVKHTA